MWKDYFYFTRGEQKGLAILAFLILLLVCARFAIPVVMNERSSLVSPPDSILLLPADERESLPAGHEYLGAEAYRLVDFDPNSVTYNELLDFGVRPRVAANWSRFIERGGRFRAPEEVIRVYGMDQTTLTRLTPYMRFTSLMAGKEEPHGKILGHAPMVDLDTLATLPGNWPGWDQSMVDSLVVWGKSYRFGPGIRVSRVKEWNMDSLLSAREPLSLRDKVRANPYLRFDINTVDTTELIALRGIGTVLSRRIIAYREALGGFTRVEQIAEVHGISGELFDEIKHHLEIKDSTIRTINVNKASVRRLRAHPYIDFYQASAIVNARLERGSFNHVDEIKAAVDIDTLEWEKLEPYIKVND